MRCGSFLARVHRFSASSNATMRMMSTTVFRPHYAQIHTLDNTAHYRKRQRCESVLNAGSMLAQFIGTNTRVGRLLWPCNDKIHAAINPCRGLFLCKILPCHDVHLTLSVQRPPLSKSPIRTTNVPLTKQAQQQVQRPRAPLRHPRPCPAHHWQQ